MDQMHRISDAVYVIMSRKEGSFTAVAIRRETVDISEIIRNRLFAEGRRGKMYVSGSHREGFGPMASDVDFMNWPNDHLVIWDLKHVEKYHTERCTLILMEFSEMHPGFTMLQLLTPTNNIFVRQSCIRRNCGIYISSAKYRAKTLPKHFRTFTQNGPCASGRVNFGCLMDFDIANCFICDRWPLIAFSFIKRCQSQRWPPYQILSDMINSGCHVVPIGLKGSPEEDNEWRISFSLAEQKLVYCMNHTQFICYALLKLFLKEVLTVKDVTNGKPLLCSYFMKTVLFWVIQNNVVRFWNPSNLLAGFWSCFKFLFLCVYRAYLPNFFIAKNNIFLTKVYGHSQQLLIDRLLEMYNLGIACLLHCKPIGELLSRAICNRQYVLSTAESDINHVLIIDVEFFYELDSNDIMPSLFSNVEHCFKTLHSTVTDRYFLTPNLDKMQLIILRKYISTILRWVVFQLYKTSNKFNLNNKRRLRFIYACLKLLKISVGMGFFSDKIYFALLLHSVGKYRDAIQFLRTIKENIIQPYIVCNRTVNIKCYYEEMKGLPLIERMRKAVAVSIDLRIIFIKELKLELSLAARSFSCVPPYVVTLMLLVLCYRGNPQKQQEALNELNILVQSDRGRHIKKVFRGISWQILGICQEICGNNQGALLSYQSFLQEEHEEPYQNLQRAAYLRICRILGQDIQ